MFLLTTAFLGLVILTYGLTMLFQLFFKVQLPTWKAFIAFVLIYLGLVLLSTDLRLVPPNKNEPGLKTILFQGNTIIIQSADDKWSNLNRYITPDTIINENINTDYNVIFGKGTLDFSMYKLEKNNTFIEVNIVGSKTDLIINKNTPLKIYFNPAMAFISYPDGKMVTPLKKYVYATPAYNDNVNAIIIRTNVVFSVLNIIEK